MSYKILNLEQRGLLELIIRGFVQFGKYKGKNIHLETFFIRVMVEFGRISGKQTLRRYSRDMYPEVLKEFRQILEGEVGQKVEIRSNILKKPLAIYPVVRRDDLRGAFAERSLPTGDK